MHILERGDRLPIITTERLVLRDVEVKDISDKYLKWLNEPEVVKYLEIRFERQTRQKVEKYITDKLNNTKHSKHFGVYDNDGARLVGTVTLPEINWNHRSADVSFVIGHPDAQRKGYATEALKAVVHYAFSCCGLEKLWAGYYDGHDASRRVLEKTGFKTEGRLRRKLVDFKNERVDHIIVGLLAEDYVAGGAPDFLGPQCTG